MPRTPVDSNLLPPIGPYTHAVKAGGQVFISATLPYPARTVIGVAALPKPGARLTMNVVAVLKD